MTEVSLTRTTEVPISITCPIWCKSSPAEHAANIWNYEGRVIHTSGDIDVPDTEGWSAYGEPTHFHPTYSVFFSTVTNPEGVEIESPVVFIDGHEHSVAQALALTDEIRRQIEQYRSTGGKA